MHEDIKMSSFEGEKEDVTNWDQLEHALYLVVSHLLHLGTPKYKNSSHAFTG